jgi:hypothetical protein
LIRRKRQSGYHRGGRRAQQIAEQAAQPIGVALHHGRHRIARAQQPAERRIEFDQDEPRGIDSLPDQRLGHRAGARSELDHGTVGIGIDETRHGAC